VRYHFIGIGGTGMRPLAQILKARGHEVSGSDRLYDKGIDVSGFEVLTKRGISILPQRGEVFERERVDKVVISVAVEEDNPELILARKKGILIRRRAEVLSEVVNFGYSIGVAGTSGKTTTCGMIGYTLKKLGWNPTVINGGVILNLREEGLLGDAIPGREDLVVYEADESDGFMELYRPTIGVITNIELDHMPLLKLREVFTGFARNVKETLIINHRYIEVLELGSVRTKIFSFGISDGDLFPEEYRVSEEGIFFRIKNTSYEISLLGFHNLLNALGAISVLKVLGLKDKEISKGIREFKGIKGRLEFLGEKRGIKIYYDVAHNPDKIHATVTTLQPYFERLIIVFQPHGYGPTRFLKKELIKVFYNILRKEDLLFIQEIYYAGGKVKRDISSKELVFALKEAGKKAFYYEERDDIVDSVVSLVKEMDGIVVMGARDRTLEGFARKLALAISS
jgi:UDP-N-acetylmuramate--alanine ligase